MKNYSTGEYRPRCIDCGVALCWSISIEEYEEYSAFWDTWTCKWCNPDYKNQYKNYKLTLENHETT